MPLKVSRDLFGKRGRDTETDFVGTITGFGVYRNASDLLLLVGKSTQGEPVSHWCSADVVDVVEEVPGA